MSLPHFCTCLAQSSSCLLCLFLFSFFFFFFFFDFVIAIWNACARPCAAVSHGRTEAAHAVDTQRARHCCAGQRTTRLRQRGCEWYEESKRRTRDGAGVRGEGKVILIFECRTFSRVSSLPRQGSVPSSTISLADPLCVAKVYGEWGRDA